MVLAALPGYHPRFLLGREPRGRQTVDYLVVKALARLERAAFQERTVRALARAAWAVLREACASPLRVARALYARYWVGRRLCAVEDARVLQASSGLSEAAFFERYGFVLLRHETAMEASDWFDMRTVQRVYGGEVLGLLPRLGVEGDAYPPPHILRRGPTHIDYGEVIHQDYGIGADDFEDNIRAYASDKFATQWRAHYETPAVLAVSAIGFWRPCKPMVGPVRAAPARARCTIARARDRNVTQECCVRRRCARSRSRCATPHRSSCATSCGAASHATRTPTGRPRSSRSSRAPRTAGTTTRTCASMR